MDKRFSTITDLHHYISNQIGDLYDHEEFRDEIVKKIGKNIIDAANNSDLNWGDDWEEPMNFAFGEDNWIKVLNEVIKNLGENDG